MTCRVCRHEFYWSVAVVGLVVVVVVVVVVVMVVVVKSSQVLALTQNHVRVARHMQVYNRKAMQEEEAVVVVMAACVLPYREPIPVISYFCGTTNTNEQLPHFLPLSRWCIIMCWIFDSIRCCGQPYRGNHNDVYCLPSKIANHPSPLWGPNLPIRAVTKVGGELPRSSYVVLPFPGISQIFLVCH
jgi:hypothetical protein